MNSSEESIAEPTQAWDIENELEKEGTKDEEPFGTSYDIFKDYTEYSTIQGLIYIFFSYQTIVGRIFWSVVIFLMVILGLYWTISAYQDWQQKPVLTTITTTAYNVEQVEFPAVTFCSPGLNEVSTYAGYLKLFFDYLEQIGEAKNVSSIDASKLNSMPVDNMTAEQKSRYYNYLKKLYSQSFIQFSDTFFPGLNHDIDVIGMFLLLLSKNPDNVIVSMVAKEGGFDPCKNVSSTTRRKRGSTQLHCVAADEVLDQDDGLCFKASPFTSNLQNSKSFCYFTELLSFDADSQVSGLLDLLNGGNLTLPPEANNSFYLDAQRDQSGKFVFKSGFQVNSFSHLKLHQDNGLFPCLAAQYVPQATQLIVFQTDCKIEYGTICREIGTPESTCQAGTFKKENTLDLLVNPILSGFKKQGFVDKKAEWRNIFSNTNLTGSYTAMFKSQWYGTLPCSDLRMLTSESEGERSILRYCEWKGQPISCAAIFKAFPTDEGICCSFNMKAADEIFKGNTYPNLIKDLQSQDSKLSFLNSTPTDYYTMNKEPKTLPGRNKGLLVILDAHNDLLSTGSRNSDYQGFVGLISPSGSFPFTMFESFDIRPGHNNLIALSGSRVDADDGMRSLDRSPRNCLFPDENDMLIIHKNYSYTNCIFECNLLYAKSKLQKTKGLNYSCIPWYFPSSDESITMCDPWEAVDFLDIMSNTIPDSSCSYCLPDCTNTIYESSISAIPFERCANSNFGVSPMCNLENALMPQPRKYGAQVLAEYEDQFPYPDFLQKIESNLREFGKTTDELIFKRDVQTYDAYDKDIAMVQIYFKKSTILQMTIQPRMTWIDFFSNVGGLLGLVLGMGIVSFVELIWLCLRIGAKKLNLTEWIR